VDDKSRLPAVSTEERYLIAAGIGVLLLGLGALFAWNDKESLPMTAAGGVLVFFGLAAGTLKAVKFGKEGAELEFESAKLTAVAATLDRAASAAAPVHEPSPPSTALAGPSLDDVMQEQAARNAAALAQAAAAIRADTPEEFGARLADLAAATGVTLNYSYDEVEPGDISNLKVWTTPRRE
jgi:hypothetical protein